MKSRGQPSAGFTLLELMIVIAILAIIAAIAIPNLIRARASANEASAVAAMRTIHSVSVRYRVRFLTYASTLNDLIAAGFVPSNMASKSGYAYNYTGATDSFSCTADPLNPGISGFRYFYVATDGVIRFSSTGTATAADTPVD